MVMASSNSGAVGVGGSSHTVFVYGSLLADDVVQVLIGLSARELDILDMYEDEEYDKRVVDVSLLDASEVLQAYTYVWGNSTDPDLYGEWDFEEFKESKLKDYVEMTKSYVQELRYHNIATKADGGIECEPCDGRGWLVCDFCKGQKTNVKSETNRIYRRCPSCRAVSNALCNHLTDDYKLLVYDRLVENCNALDVNRNLNQCRRKWDSLLSDYRKIKQSGSKKASFNFELFKGIERYVREFEGGYETEADSDPDEPPLAAILGSKNQRSKMMITPQKHTVEVKSKPARHLKSENFEVEECSSEQQVDHHTHTFNESERFVEVNRVDHEQKMAEKLRENAELIEATTTMEQMI
ncbi:hypothetical protein L1987_17208 [Smallanthus sonchifolius]|uniref:Uncharacterized protein n=1 Tax=Smallanthus sonchifolius TaxID=185202 RepID=A0ACB9IW93_9ASTR|nr:hypothetical protein L1987_17208 [Smallanthus sonchifolius]